MRLVILLLLCPIFSLAQTGPGGSGSTDGSSNLVVWLKADKGSNITPTAINGIKVNAWADQAGYQVVGIPSQLEQRPTFKFNAINDVYPIISFDGKNDFFQLFIQEDDEENDDDDDQDDDDDDDENDEDDDDQDEDQEIINPLDIKNNFTIIFVAKANVIHDTDPMTVIEDGNFHGLDFQKYVLAPTFKSGNNAGFGVSLGTNGIAAYEYGFNYFPAVNSINNNPPYFLIGNEFHIWKVEVVNKKSTIYMDGEFISEGVNSGIGNLFIPNEIGGGMTEALVNFDNFFEGELAELVIYANTINTSENIAIHNYLSAKYNIELTELNVYEMDSPNNGNFDHNVAGIGSSGVDDVLLGSKGTGIVCISNPSDLNEGEYMFWGTDKIEYNELSNETPEGAASMLATTWAVSEIGDIGQHDVCLNYDVFGDINPKDIRLVIDSNNDGSFLDETIPAELSESLVAIDEVTATITFKEQNLNNGDQFTFASKSTFIQLPVSLTSFRANVVENKKVDLAWVTESETDNQYFIVERSADSRIFSPIGMVEGNGTTQFTSQYQLQDSQPFRGDNYYRLKQIDLDGTFSYSNIIKASITIEKEDIFVYPNPTHSDLTIQLPNAAVGEILIQVYDATGQIVFTKTEPQDHLSNIRITTHLDTGIYMLRVRTKNFTSSKSFVVIEN